MRIRVEEPCVPPPDKRCFDYACRFASESASFAQHDIKKVAGKSKAADRNDLPPLMKYPRTIRVIRGNEFLRASVARF
jgi:hypothetical protein